MAYGFVYLLANPAMRGFYKIGSTERAPHQRLAELSGSTAVPMPFNLVCYIEVEDARAVEAALHRHLSDFRVNSGREFFAFHRDSRPWLYGLFRRHPQALSFAEVDLDAIYHPDISTDIDPWRDDEADGPELPSNAPLRFFEISELG